MSEWVRTASMLCMSCKLHSRSLVSPIDSFPPSLSPFSLQKLASVLSLISLLPLLPPVDSVRFQKLAINGPGGRFQVSVAGSSTLDQVIYLVDTGNVPKSLQKLSSGFPPKDIAIEPQKTIQGAGIVNGDMIRVTQAEAAPAAAPAGSGAGRQPLLLTLGPFPVAMSDVSVGWSGRVGWRACVRRKTGRPLRSMHARGVCDVRCRPRVWCWQFVRKVIPADNSCLFNSVAYCVEGRRMDMGPGLPPFALLGSPSMDAMLPFMEAMPPFTEATLTMELAAAWQCWHLSGQRSQKWKQRCHCADVYGGRTAGAHSICRYFRSRSAVGLRARYAVSGTDLAHDLCDVRY
eukprot:3185471-Rhodomonas_salina.1